MAEPSTLLIIGVGSVGLEILKQKPIGYSSMGLFICMFQ